MTQVISQLPTISIPSTAGYTSSLLGYSIFPQLQGILQANMLQRVCIFFSALFLFFLLMPFYISYPLSILGQYSYFDEAVEH